MPSNKIKYQLFIFLVFIGKISFAQETINYNNLKLNDAIEIALKQNKKLKIQTLRSTISALNEKDLRNEKLPNFDFHTSFHVLDNIHQYEHGLFNSSTSYETPRIKYDLTLSAEIPIYMGGKIKYEVDKAIVETDIQLLKYKEDQKTVKMQIITAYLQNLHLQEQQKLIEDKMHEDSVVIVQTEKLKKNGVVTNNDVLRTNLQLSNHKMIYSDLEKDITILENQIITILALPSDMSIHLDTKNLLTTTSAIGLLDEIMHTALANNESFLMIEKEEALSKLDKKLTKANVLPKITFGGEYGYNYPNFMFFPPQEHLYRFGTLGFNLTLPISNLYKNKPKMRIANEKISIAKLEIEEKEEQIAHELFSATKKLEEVSKKIIIAQEAIKQAEENYRIVKLKYINKLSLITELIDADNAYLEAQSNLISLQINKQLKNYQLQYILGNI